MSEPEKTSTPMPLEQFNKEIDRALEDSKNDRVISTSDLLAKIKTWGLETPKSRN